MRRKAPTEVQTTETENSSSATQELDAPVINDSATSTTNKVVTGMELFGSERVDDVIPKKVNAKRCHKRRRILKCSSSSSSEDPENSSSSSNPSSDELSSDEDGKSQRSHMTSKKRPRQSRTEGSSNISEELSLLARGELPFIGKGAIHKSMKRMAKEQKKKWDQVSLKNMNRMLSSLENDLMRRHKDEAAQNVDSGE